MERRSLKCLTVPLRVTANVLTLSRSTTSESSSTTVRLVELSTLGTSSITIGTSSGSVGLLSTSSPPQVVLVGAAEVKMVKQVRKRSTERVKVERVRDIVTDEGSVVGHWGPDSTERQTFYTANDNHSPNLCASCGIKTPGVQYVVGVYSNAVMSGRGCEIPFRGMQQATCLFFCFFRSS